MSKVDYALEAVVRLQEVEKQNTTLTIKMSKAYDIIKQLEAENKSLKSQIPGYTPDPQEQVVVEELPKKFTRNRRTQLEAFPWTDYPEVEHEAAIMFVNGLSDRDIQDYVEKATGINRQHGRIVNARFNNGRPPEYLEIRVLSEGPTTWSELWKIGSHKTTKGWAKRLLTSIGAFSKIAPEGSLPSGFMGTDPNLFLTPEQISIARQLYHNNLII